jgi:nucleoside-diphosphate-sugar epimerase
LDTGYFSNLLTTTDAWPERLLDRQIVADARDPDSSAFTGVDAVVALAAISNDPMGAKYENVTLDVNQRAIVHCAHTAAAAGVSRFVFASSCSVYGFAEGHARGEDAPLNPQTAYARSKIGTERALQELDAPGMTTTALRFATACGPSPRLRLDLVLNDFAACAFTAREITVLSDGSPWRPLIDVRDMARAVEWALVRSPTDGGNRLAVNVGADHWNYQVRDLAHAVADQIDGVDVSINENASPDTRSYKVDFSLFRHLAPDYQPILTLKDTVRDLITLLADIGFADQDFRNSRLIRLRALDDLVSRGWLDSDLRWISHT